MTTLPGQTNGVELSGKIYQDIMSSTDGRRPLSNRACSAKSVSTQLSFPTSPRNSARSKACQSSKQGAYSDFDIIKNRSWSGSKVKNSSFVKINTKRADSARSSINLSTPVGEHRSPVREQTTSSTVSQSQGREGSSRELWHLKGSQVERLHQEWAAIEHCRAMKRASEMVQHRLDPMYRISGSTVPLLARYQVNESDIQRLREMSETSRILQLDLKRIKYPQTYRSPRRDKTNGTKAKGKGQAQTDRGTTSADNGVAGLNDGRHGVHDIETSPFPEQSTGQGVPHPSSPVSTPDTTPRNVGAEGETNSTQGDTSQKENVGEDNS